MTKKNLILIAIALLAGPVAAHAQTNMRPAYQYPPAPEGSGPGSVQLGDSPIYMAPYLGFGAGRDDNVLMQSTNEVDSPYYVTTGGLRFDARSSNSVIQAGYQVQYGRYSDSIEDNYTDQNAKFQFDTAIDRRNFLRLGLDWVRGHDPRGSTDRGISDQPDRYKMTTPSAMYAFGAPGAAGRVEAYYTYADKHYLNNRAVTVTSDRETTEFGAAFYWRVMPKTYLMAEARRTDLSYREPNSPLSAMERRYYAGVMWDATASTSGTIKVGRLQREFEHGTAPDFSGPSWEAVVTWTPRTYSKFDFFTGRQTNESTGLGNFILTSITGVTWSHSWSSVLMTGVDVRYQKDEYQGFDRTDEVKSIGLKVGYKFRRWLTLGAEYTHTQRDSNIPGFEYDRNLYLLTATATL
jgi:hypothetical protein